MSDNIVNPFGIVNPVSGEVTEQEVNPTKEDLKLIKEKEKRLAEEAKKNLKTVKVADGTATTKRPAKNKRAPQAPVVAAGKPQQQNVPQKPKQIQSVKEYLVCFVFEGQDMTEPDWTRSRWITAEGRGLCFAKTVSMIHDITSENEDFYDPIDYEESFVLCTGVKYEEKVPLLQFIRLCIEKEAKAIDKYMLDYMQAVLKSYETGSFEPIDEWVKVNNDTPCTPQVQQTMYTSLEGEDIN
jgi:hypothetical protein